MKMVHVILYLQTQLCKLVGAPFSYGLWNLQSKDLYNLSHNPK